MKECYQFWEYLGGIPMMGAWTVIWLASWHWIADFVCQTHWQASNKSKNWNALARHVAVYTTIVGFAGSMTLQSLDRCAIFIAVTFVAHFATDAITSRITSRLYAKGDWHNFFAVIGFDQLLHTAQIWLTLAYLASVYDGR